MKTGIFSFCVVFFLSLLNPTVQGEMRQWTSIAGTTIEAEFVELKYDIVYLKTADGETKQIPKPKLIRDDQLLISNLSNPFAGKNPEEAEETPKASDALYDLFGKELRDARKKKASVDALADKTIGIYFSAHWCPPCRAFTPVLVEFHNEMSRQGKPFEIVFVSSDRDKGSMYNYMKEMEMPWLALPFGDSHKGPLSKAFHVSGIPKLVIIDSEGKLITENGRGDVSSKGNNAFDSWQ